MNILNKDISNLYESLSCRGLKVDCYLDEALCNISQRLNKLEDLEVIASEDSTLTMLREVGTMISDVESGLTLITKEKIENLLLMLGGHLTDDLSAIRLNYYTNLLLVRLILKEKAL